MNEALRTCAAILLLCMANPAGADLYGYVDEKGVAHLSRVPLHEGYYLFKKEPPEPLRDEPMAVIPDFPVPAAARTAHVNPAYRKQYGPLVTAVAREHKLDVALLHAVITVESGDAKDDVETLFKRYSFRAIPVVDAIDNLVGVLRFKDIFLGQKGPVSGP